MNSSRSSCLEAWRTDVIFAARQSAFACDWTPLHNDAMYAILPADYPTDDRETFPITEFEGRDFLMPYGRFDIDVGAAFRKYGVKPVIRPCHVDDETVIRMVGKGLGISMMAEMMLRGKLNGVKTLPVSPSVSRELGMGLRRAAICRRASPPARMRAGVYRGALNMKKAAGRQPFYLNFTVFPSGSRAGRRSHGGGI